MPANAPLDLSKTPTRAFGNFDLRGLLGKSARTMVWLARDRRSGADVMLTLPREAPIDATDRALWFESTRRLARLNHPHLATVLEISTHDRWPFVAVERAGRMTLLEWRDAHQSPPPSSAAGWIRDALQGLAYAHEAGGCHGDLQLHHLLVDERGRVSVMGLGAASDPHPVSPHDRPRAAHGMGALVEQRRAAERDVLACGVILHQLLAGNPPLADADVGSVIERMSPLGREAVQLPWTTPQPVPESLRAIANRATAPQERLRYRAARTLHFALSGWLAAQSQDGGGPMAMLLDRIGSGGHLPAMPDLAVRVTRVTSIEGQRTEDMSAQILGDLALSFELLRTLNSIRVRGMQIADNGTVLALRRAVALIGVEGVRRAAAALRPWPGALSGDAAPQLKACLDQARLAGTVAQSLRPAGYDAEAVYLIAVMQNLGRLLVRYHFVDEAEQIDHLMRPAVSTDSATGHAATAGMSEEGAAYAVLGVDFASIGHAVAKQWGLGDDVLQMIRRVPRDAPPRKPEDDLELLRMVASAANEAVDVLLASGSQPPRHLAMALDQVNERYARVLKLAPNDVQDAVRGARALLRRDLQPSPRGPRTGEPAVSPAIIV